ncbi:MAG: hypothetical protein Q7T90_08920 [Thiobacillus sp.]|nr:hypothetical protein [Thiobacillus sp.]
MKRVPTPLLWLAVALIGMALVAGSFIMVAWLKLQPDRSASPSERFSC